MRIHPRTHDANIARSTFAVDVWRLLEKSDMTTVEALQAVAGVQADLAKILLRGERHPKHPDHKADEACERAKCPGRWPDVRAQAATTDDNAGG